MRRLPPATLALVGAILLAYAAELAAGGMGVCERFGLVPERFMRTGDLVPVFGSLFLHDPNGLAHVAGNVLALLACGLVLEPLIGSVRFFALYVAAGVFGGLLHVAVDPSSSVALVSASGAIAGTLAAAGAFRPRLVGFAAGFIAWNVWLALSGTAGNVSAATHLGGAFVGVVFAIVRAARFGSRPRFVYTAQ